MPGNKKCKRSCKCKKHKRNKKTEWIYKNIKMRSSFEIMAALAMDLQKIKWVYEPQLFKFGKTWYLPDFYLPEQNVWVEVKGYMTRRGRIKIKAFKKAGHPLQVWRQKDLEKMLGMSSAKFIKQYRKGEINAMLVC